MNFIDRLLGKDTSPAPETKSVNLSALIEEALAQSEGASRPASQLFGIPAVLSAIRLISETAAMLPLHVYRDVEHGHERAGEAWQADLFKRRPAPDFTPFDWRADAYSMLLGYGNFYARKIKTGSGARRRVRYLIPFDPRRVKAEWDGYGIVYTISDSTGKVETLTRKDVFHVRGFTFHGEAMGMSPITVCRRALSSGVSLEEYFERFLRHVRQHDQVWLATREEIARRWIALHPAPAAG